MNLFSYLDYRLFLKDWYLKAKKTGSTSLRHFSKQAGFTSPNYLKLVMDGERNLTEESIEKFVMALDLNKQEQEFFRNLVGYNQTQSHEEKNRYYQRLIQSRKFVELKPIAKHQYEYYINWYHAVIRELVSGKPLTLSYEDLSRQVNPSITPQQAKKSVKLLEKLGLIQKDKYDCWQQCESVVMTGAEPADMTMLTYHQKVLDLAKKVLKEVPREKRDVSALTLGISPDMLPLIKQKIYDFQKEILKLVVDSSHATDVVLLTTQLFPVTKENRIES